MLSHILKYTNQHAAAHYARKKVQWDAIDMIELKAFVGILYLLGVSKGNHENIRNLCSDGPMARPVFKATMSVNRFEIIRCHLRFDSIDTRQERRARDKFAPFRELWNFFESKCRENYKPSAEVYIDEQLIPFRGRCSFRQYMPSKPDKYGMKLFLLVDCNTGYVYTGQPYVGKIGNEITRGLAAKVVKSLAETLYHAGRNITADNYFTDFALASELLLKKTTYVGTLRKNKSDIFLQNSKPTKDDQLDQLCLVLTKIQHWYHMFPRSLKVFCLFRQSTTMTRLMNKLASLTSFCIIIILREQWIQWIRCVTPTACRGRLKDGLLLIS